MKRTIATLAQTGPNQNARSLPTIPMIGVGLRRGALVAVLALLVGALPVHSQGWQPVPVGSNEDLNAVWFVSATTGWVVGNTGTLRVTTNGGESWQSLAVTAEDLGDVTFRGESLGLIAGDNGRVFRTVNGGNNWNQVPAVTDVNLAATAFGGPGRAYAAGRDGVILRSLDDGATWEVADTGTVRYRRIAARGDSAWVVGEGGVIRRTDDGGTTWSTQTSGTSNDLKAICFINTLEGWAAGQNDTLLHTSDGGANWAPSNSGIDTGLDGVFFGNAHLGWAVGDTGTVFASTDGGQSWQREATGISADLSLVFFADAFHGWTTGTGGMLLARREEPVRVAATGGSLVWPDVPGATGYDVVVGNLETLRATGDVGQAVDRCLVAGQLAPAVDLSGTAIPPHSAWFLVRPLLDESGTNGSYDSGSFSQQKDRDVPIAGTGLDCF